MAVHEHKERLFKPGYGAISSLHSLIALLLVVLLVIGDIKLIAVRFLGISLDLVDNVLLGLLMLYSATINCYTAVT